jgi:putative transposase
VKKRKFSDDKILAVLAEVDGGTSITETCRKHGISEPTFHRWRAEFAGVDKATLVRRRELEEENARLKKLLADTMLANEILKEVNERLGKR